MNSRRIGILLAVYVVSFTALAYLFYRGHVYYLTPLVERPRHADYWALKPGGTLGYRFGVVGASLMVVMHLYSVRKRARPLRRVGRLGGWLDFHIYCGVMGPLLIVLHSSFKVQGLVAISFWAMVAVAVSGILGRYLYLQIPRRRSGDQLTLAEAEELNGRITVRLRDEFGLSTEDLQQLQAIAESAVDDDASLLGLLLKFPVQGLTMRWRLRRFARGLRIRSDRILHQLLAVARQKVLFQRRILLWQRLQQLFHYWHVFHKPFAIVMYLFMAVHVTVAVVTGYGWIRGD
jgi:hypothetical protein